MSRSPWIDDRISTLVKDNQIEQLVIIAAGLDTRAYRLPDLDKVSVYELDLPPMVEAKNRLINELELQQASEIPLSAKSITRIPGNLLESNWTQSIIDAGFDPEKPAIILQEGSIYYFQPEEVDAILSAIRSLSASGSHLLLDCMTTEGIKQYPFDKFPGQEPTFHTPIDNPEQSFEAQGFDQVDVDKMKEFYFIDAKVE